MRDAAIGEVYLTLHVAEDGAASSVAVARQEALLLDRKGFAKLYRRHVYGASRREANKWADHQIKLREEALRA